MTTTKITGRLENVFMYRDRATIVIERQVNEHMSVEVSRETGAELVPLLGSLIVIEISARELE